MLKTAAALLSISLITSLAAQADESDAAHNVQEKCTRCHGSEIYTRDDHKVKSLASLGKQVRMCNTNTGAQWFEDDVNDVIDYLNLNFYKFEK